MQNNINFAELENKINAANKTSASIKEKTLDKLTSEARKLLKEAQRLDKALQGKQQRLEKLVHNIENIDDYLQKLSNKGKQPQPKKASGE